jgi:hypothetical protein
MKTSAEEDLKANLPEQKNISKVSRIHRKDNIYIRLIHTKNIIFLYSYVRHFPEIEETKSAKFTRFCYFTVNSGPR